MKKTLLSRRGAVIEMAIGVMLLMIAVSIVLLTLATIKHDRKEDDVAELEDRIEINEIGEYVCENIENYKEANNAPIKDATDYYVTTTVIEESTENSKYQLVITKNDTTVLTIEIDSTGKIISWK